MDKWHFNHLDSLEVKTSFTNELFMEDFAYMTPKLLIIYAFINNFCFERGIEFRVTSLVRSPEYDKVLGATSKTHQDGRALDFSIIPFSYAQVQELIDEVNTRFKDIGAISASTGKSRPINVHKNHDSVFGSHAHVQVRP